MEWQPIETAPENTYILVWKPYLEPNVVEVDRFRWVELSEDEFVRQRGNEKTYRTVTRRDREWEKSGGDWWMPIPAPPSGTP